MIAVLLACLVTADAQTWVLRQEVVTQAKDPNPMSKSGWRDVRTTSTGVVEWVERGGELVWLETICSIETSPVLGVRTEYGSAFLGSLQRPARQTTFDGEALQVGPDTALLGAESSDLQSAVDTDGDGEPGVTVRISHPLMGSGEVYVAQVVTSRFTGQRQDSGAIRGTVAFDLTQRTLGASRWWLKHQPPVRVHPEPERSWFELEPAPAGTTCADL